MSTTDIAALCLTDNAEIDIHQRYQHDYIFPGYRYKQCIYTMLCFVYLQSNSIANTEVSNKYHRHQEILVQQNYVNPS